MDERYFSCTSRVLMAFFSSLRSTLHVSIEQDMIAKKLMLQYHPFLLKHFSQLMITVLPALFSFHRYNGHKTKEKERIHLVKKHL